jgi:hypothetical protein
MVVELSGDDQLLLVPSRERVGGNVRTGGANVMSAR